VRILRSPELEIIGVGEGSTAALTDFLPQYLRVPSKTSHELAAPTWKLGLKFLHWGRANTSIILLDPDWKFALCQNSGNRTDSTATKISIIRTRIPR
jgi:tryptophan halogenase